jgi:hypothetical protein
MSEAELRRVREDLEMMRQAAGLELPFDWADVSWALALVPAGAVLSAWAYLGPAGYYGFGLVPLGLLILSVAAHEVWKLRRGNPSLARRRQNTIDVTTTLVGAAAMAAYLIWEKTLGLPGSTGGAIACFFLGVLFAVTGVPAAQGESPLQGPWRWSRLGCSFPIARESK